jgi:transketolase
MRTEFIAQLTRRAKKDKRIFLVVGDLGYNVVDEFQRALPGQFLNAGVAEQNMIGLSAGLALSGKIVFVYSIANFPTIRALEQVRNDVCYHNANVNIISVGAGFHYGPLGATHHATEDLAIMRALPNMTVLAPGDPMEAQAFVDAMIARKGPCYIRLGIAPQIHKKIPNFSIGKALTIKQGKDIALIATGGMLTHALEASQMLAKKGMHARVISMHTVKPLDDSTIKKAAKETRGLITIEEHTIIGGLGSAVAESLADQGLSTPLRRIGIPDTFTKYVGDQAYLKEKYGLTTKNIVKQAQSLLK